MTKLDSVLSDKLYFCDLPTSLEKVEKVSKTRDVNLYIKRDDIAAVTISYYFALKTWRWVLKAEDRKEYLDTFIPFNEKELIPLYKRVRYYVHENNWERYLKEGNCLFINFTDLMKNPLTTFENVLVYLKIDPNTVDIEKLMQEYEFVPTKRPETDEYRERLKKIVCEQEI